MHTVKYIPKNIL